MLLLNKFDYFYVSKLVVPEMTVISETIGPIAFFHIKYDLLIK